MTKANVLSLTAALLACSALLGACHSLRATPEYKIVRAGDIGIEISVVDEQGAAVPFADVWLVTSLIPVKASQYTAGDDREVSFDYLAWLANRYRNVAEYASVQRPRILSPLPEHGYDQPFRILPTADPAGKTKTVIKYLVPRNVPVTIEAYALRYGYVPQKLRLQAARHEQHVGGTIVLRRDPGIRLSNSRYEKWFGEVRYDSKEDSPNHSDHPEPDRRKLIKAAQEAEANGDVQTAARIYAWVPLLHTTIQFRARSGRTLMTGFEREDELSARNLEILDKAHALDPANRYVQMKRVLLNPARDRKSLIADLEKLVSGGRDDLWPQVFIMLEKQYYLAGERDKARREFLWFRQSEPEYSSNKNAYLKIREARYISLARFKADYIVDGDINKRDRFRWQPMFYAIQAGRTDLFDYLVEMGAERRHTSWWFVQAIISGDVRMFRHLLNNRVAMAGVENANAEYFYKEVSRLLDTRDTKAGDALERQEIERAIEEHFRRARETARMVEPLHRLKKTRHREDLLFVSERIVF